MLSRIKENKKRFAILHHREVQRINMKIPKTNNIYTSISKKTTRIPSEKRTMVTSASPRPALNIKEKKKNQKKILVVF